MNKEEIKRLIVTKPNSFRAKVYRQICEWMINAVNSELGGKIKLVLNNDFSADIISIEFNVKAHLDDIFERFTGFRMTGKFLVGNEDFNQFFETCAQILSEICGVFAVMFKESSIVMFDVKGDFPVNSFSGLEHVLGNIWSFTESITIDPQNVNECRFDEIRVNNVRMNPEQPVTFTFGEDYTVTGIVQSVSSAPYVDLGLPSGTKWATCNIGASTPQEAGNYFAWGETEVREGPYEPETYKLTGADTLHGSQIYKALNGYDGLKELDIDHDAAYITRGSHWRTPSDEQVEELIANTTAEYDDSGMTLTSNINGKSIYLPFKDIPGGPELMYMTRSFTKMQDDSLNILNISVISLYIDNSRLMLDHGLRCWGLPIRPVYVDNPDCVEYEGEWIDNFADFHLPSGTLWSRNMLNNSPNYFFAWAETTERQNNNESFGWENYYYWDDNEGELTDDYYNENKEEYTEGNPGYNITVTNNLIHLRESDDPARRLNAKTSMPTVAQWKELVDHTTIEYDGSSLHIYNEFDDIMFNVKKGVFYDELSNGTFWTNELAMGDGDFNAVSIRFDNNGHISIESDSRCSGLNVLPVARKYFDNDENE